MDVVMPVYYAVVCGALGLLAPHVPNWPGRLAVGTAVGVAAAWIAPWVHGIFGPV